MDKIDIENSLIVAVDLQNDFIFADVKDTKNHPNGVISSEEAKMMIGNVEVFIRNCADSEKNLNIVFIKDTHYLKSDAIPSEMWYTNSLEGRKLPIVHCIKGTDGWKFPKYLEDFVKNSKDSGHVKVIEKMSFAMNPQQVLDIISGSWSFKGGINFDKIIIFGICTDVCVLSNAILFRSYLPNIPIYVLKDLCAGSYPDSHEAALTVMNQLQFDVIESKDIEF